MRAKDAEKSYLQFFFTLGGATRATEAERPAQIEANDQTKTLEQNRQRRNFAAELKKEKAKATQKGQKMHFSCKKISE